MKWPNAGSVNDANDVTPPPSAGWIVLVCAISIATCLTVAYAYFKG